MLKKKTELEFQEPNSGWLGVYIENSSNDGNSLHYMYIGKLVQLLNFDWFHD